MIMFDPGMSEYSYTKVPFQLLPRLPLHTNYTGDRDMSHFNLSTNQRQEVWRDTGDLV